MFLEKIKSEGIAHLSYIIGSKKIAAVIDPRRDVDIYIDSARRVGVTIKYIFTWVRWKSLKRFPKTCIYQWPSILRLKPTFQATTSGKDA